MANLVRSGIWLGDKKMANDYFDRYRHIIDIRANNEFQKSMSEMQVKYETEKKQLKIDVLEKEKKLFLLLTFLGAFVLILLITALFLGYKNVKHQKRIVEEEIKNLEQKQKLLATQAVLDGETAERSRLAKDLHDSLGGMLAVVKLNLLDTKKMTVMASGEVLSFNKAIDLLDNTIKELRRVAHHMMPESLMRFGLKVALSDFCESIPIAAFQHFGTDNRIENKIEILLYRSAHELVHNALKHSEATQIIVQLIQESDRISLSVHDNGKGFEAKKDFNGMGLKNIKQRVEIYNGIIDIFSEMNKGTEVSLSFQLNHDDMI
jgi:signal transduction histidine kinase